MLPNGFAKCTCLPGFIESPNTIRGCIEQRNPCDPNPCGHGAQCDPQRLPVCFCPLGTAGNPYRVCSEPLPTPVLCSPGPCGVNADCYIVNNEEQCYCHQGYVGDPFAGCRLLPPSPCVPNPCGPNAQCVVSPEGHSMCRCPEGMGGDPTGPIGCHGYECIEDDECSDHQACISYRCRDPCPGSCGINANCRVEKHHPVCTCNPGLTGNPVIRCFPLALPAPKNPCLPSPCGANTICKVVRNKPVCSCIPDFQGDPRTGCSPECVLNTDCALDKVCLNRHCVNPCSLGDICGVNAICKVRDHAATCVCPNNFVGDAFYQCIPKRKFKFTEGTYLDCMKTYLQRKQHLLLWVMLVSLVYHLLADRITNVTFLPDKLQFAILVSDRMHLTILPADRNVLPTRTVHSTKPVPVLHASTLVQVHVE